MDYVEQGEVKQLIIQRKDGSTWTAEIGLDGRVRLLDKLNDPAEAYQYEEEDEPQEEEQQQLGSGTPEQEEGQPEDAGMEQGEDGWGEATLAEDEYTDAEINDFIQNMQHRGSSDKDYQMGKAPAHKLSDKYHKKLKDPAFLARLNSIMLDNKFARRVRGRTRGKLDMGRLYKVPTRSRSVFMQKQERKGKQYNVVLTVDQSGSMSGRPAEVAAETVLFLAKQFENLNLNIGVIGYGSDVKVHKELNSSKFNYDELYSELIRSRGGTNDYPALRRAYHMFKTAPEGENLLIHISDGSPGAYYDTVYRGANGKVEKLRGLEPLAPGADTYGYGSSAPDYINYNEKDHLHHLVKSHHDVMAFGIGIQEGGWQIPDHVVVHSVDQLKPEILKFLRKNIRRG